MHNNGTDVYGGHDAIKISDLGTASNRLGLPNTAYTFKGNTNSYF